jgi:cyanophycinase
MAIMCPSPVPDGYVRGPVFYDGGADHSIYNEYARNAFWNLAGGYGARIVVLTTNADASQADYGYAAAFQALEAARVRLIAVRDRASGSDSAILQAIEQSTAVFLSGGHPLQWSTRIGGTALATALRRANACGKAVGAVGGSAAFLGNHMLVYRDDSAFPCMAPGLGLSNRMLVAAHYDPSLRGELLRAAIAANPYMLGIGLPDQAAFIWRADALLEVVGLASVQIVDGSQMTGVNLLAWQPGTPFQAEGLRVVDLPPDYRYDPDSRRVLTPELSLPLPVRSSL